MTPAPPDKLWLLWNPGIGHILVDDRDVEAARESSEGSKWRVIGPYHLDPVASLLAAEAPGE